MVWAGGAYGGQVAVRLGNLKAIRRQLFMGKKTAPLNWEVYDLANDREETNDLAPQRKDVIEAAVEVLKKEYTPSEAYKELAFLEQEQ
jgi:arylsulfatase A-like enzyme